MNFQVLIVTMNQKDLGLADRMNIQCDAIISNQADFESVLNKNVQFGKLKMITTPTKGVGLNRNIRIMASTADIILFVLLFFCRFNLSIIFIVSAPFVF